MLNNKDWILVSNGANAKFFVYQDKKLQLIKEFHSDLAQLRSEQLGDDRPGRTGESQGHARHAIEPRADIHQKEREKFIQNIIEFLNEQAYNKKLEHIILVAASEILGEIRVDLSKHSKALVKKEINKDLVYMSDSEILEHIKGYD